MVSPALSFFLVGLVLAPAIVGAVIIGLSWKKVRSFPACGHCGYDVTGSVGKVSRCPECGRLFTEAGIVPPRPKRRAPLIFAAAVFLVLVVAGVGSVLSFRMAARARVAEAQAARAAALARAAQAAQAQAARAQARRAAGTDAALSEDAPPTSPDR